MAARSRHILVGYDGTEPGRRALAAAAELAGYGSTLSVAAVAVSNGAVVEPGALVHEAREELLRRHVQANYLQPMGDVGDVIVDAATRLQADLVVVGRGGRLRSASVVSRAPCDVLVVS